MATIAYLIIQAFLWSGFFLFYFTLGCPVTLQYISVMYLN